ncbi:AGC protein kinase [Phytophthora cinnamomi]|uniref:AGC protein kinase n=1 Tax=Phytophthora cinnamomi TaxID=4785 RepID=UPI00355A7E13|nr:AGC protein kinase [Phytophthora cinnamomi]
MEVSSASPTPPEIPHSNVADAAPPHALEPEIEALASSSNPSGETEKSTENGKDQEEGEKEEKEEENDDRKSRDRTADLNMLADTVRSIVTDVVGAVGTLEDSSNVGEQEREGEDKGPLVETSEGDAVDIEMIPTTPTVESSRVVPDTASEPRDNHEETAECSNVGMQDAAEAPEVGTQGSSDGDPAAAVAASSSSSSDNNAAAAGASSSKRPAADLEEAEPAPKKKRSEYSEEIRALCVQRHQTEGASYATISKELEIPHDTVRAIVRKAKRTGSVSSAPRSGRPRKTSGIVDKVILEAVKANKQCSAKAIQQDLLRVFGVKISPETVRRRVLEHTKQRMQTVSGGVSCELSAVGGENNKFITGVEIEMANPSQDRPHAANTSLSDSVSLQQLLHDEGQSTSGAVNGLSTPAANTKDSRDTQPAVGANSSPSSPQTATDAAGINGVPQMQPAAPPQSENGASPQKQHKRSEYSIATRERCVALRAQGQGYRQIGKSLNMPHTTVRAIVEKAQRTGSVLPAKRSGRPRKTDDIVDKVILQAVKTNEKSSARVIKEHLLAAYGVRISCETIRRRVKDHSRQCMMVASSRGITEPLPNDDTAFRQHASQEQDLLAVAMADSSSMPVANIIAFDENGVHL